MPETRALNVTARHRSCVPGVSQSVVAIATPVRHNCRPLSRYQTRAPAIHRFAQARKCVAGPKGNRPAPGRAHTTSPRAKSRACGNPRTGRLRPCAVDASDAIGSGSSFGPQMHQEGARSRTPGPRCDRQGPLSTGEPRPPGCRAPAERDARCENSRRCAAGDGRKRRSRPAFGASTPAQPGSSSQATRASRDSPKRRRLVAPTATRG